MRKVLALILVLAGCASTQPDPDNGVSNASYRMVVERSERNVASIASRLVLLEQDDLSREKPMHSQEWWIAQVGLAVDTRDLLHATLQGATK